MMGTTHTVTGVTAGSLAAVPLVLLGVDHTAVLGFVAVWATTSVLPDIDHKHGRPTKWLGPITGLLSWIIRLFVDHREQTHTRTAALIFGAVVGAATFAVSDYWWLWALATVGGCLTHLWGDARTKSGIPWNGRRKRVGKTFRTGSSHETRLRVWVYSPAAVLSVMVLLSMMIFAPGGISA